MVMRKLVVLLVSLVVLAWVPGFASAQGWLLPGLPSLPSFGGSGCGSCYGNLGGLTIGGDVAYVGYSRATTWEVTSQGPGVFNGLNDIKQSFPVHGIQLSADATASLSDRLTVIGRGTWLLPWNGQTFEDSRLNARGLAAERRWSTTMQWWTLEGAGAWAINPMSAIVGGLRYDSFQTTFKDPSDAAGFFGQIGEADLEVHLWLPYVGVVVQQGAARFGVIGLPWTPGTMRYRRTDFNIARLAGNGTVKSGYFLEAFAEFNANLMGATAGLFAKWTMVRTRSVTSLDDTVLGNGIVGDTFDVTFSRQNWILGAQAALTFNSPF